MHAQWTSLRAAQPLVPRKGAPMRTSRLVVDNPPNPSKSRCPSTSARRLRTLIALALLVSVPVIGAPDGPAANAAAAGTAPRRGEPAGTSYVVLPGGQAGTTAADRQRMCR